MLNNVEIVKCRDYSDYKALTNIPESLFDRIVPGNKIVIKPNWVMESHRTRTNEWEYVITHPALITAVIRKVLPKLSGEGRISIIDGPMTEASFGRLIKHYPVDEWMLLARQSNVEFEIIDLRDHEWEMKNDVVIKRKSLEGDPRGKVLFDLMNERSEFHGHVKSPRGYYGADYDRKETNQAHDGVHNLYSVSGTAIDCDVFINMPKLKTHRTAGITCCLKNLVGINTYKNYLPHYSEGGPAAGGDQFPFDTMNAKLEGSLAAIIKQHLFKNQCAARYLTSMNTIGKKIFGDSKSVVRNGSWHGNDTLWRTILDLNKILLYGTGDGSMSQGTLADARPYIGIVDAVQAGEGEGPLAPDPVSMGRIICGTNPAAIDAVCSILMGFDPCKIPAIAKSFQVKEYRLCDFKLNDIEVLVDGIKYRISTIPQDEVIPFKAQHGWIGHIER
ncbi:DUF362 domain-containing protein [Geobacter anodireducens]